MSSYISLNRFAALRTVVVAHLHPLLDAARVKIVHRVARQPSYIILLPVLDEAYAAFLLIFELHRIKFHARQTLDD